MNEGTHNRPSKRCTILIDEEVYAASKRQATYEVNDTGRRGIRLYQYINNVLAKAAGVNLPFPPKHPTTKKKKPDAPAPAPVLQKTSESTPPPLTEKSI